MRGAAGPESLESTLLEAAFLSEIIFGWMANTLEFEMAKPRPLTKEERSHVYWAISTLTHMIGEAHRIYLEGGR